jgi:hypothetical protein
MEIKTASDIVSRSTLLSAQFLDGKISPEARVAIIDKNSGIISTVTDVKVENHYDGPEDSEEERTLIGQTLWIEVEEI